MWTLHNPDLMRNRASGLVPHASDILALFSREGALLYLNRTGRQKTPVVIELSLEAVSPAMKICPLFQALKR